MNSLAPQSTTLGLFVHCLRQRWPRCSSIQHKQTVSLYPTTLLACSPTSPTPSFSTYPLIPIPSGVEPALPRCLLRRPSAVNPVFALKHHARSYPNSTLISATTCRHEGRWGEQGGSSERQEHQVWGGKCKRAMTQPTSAQTHTSEASEPFRARRKKVRCLKGRGERKEERCCTYRNVRVWHRPLPAAWIDQRPFIATSARMHGSATEISTLPQTTSSAKKATTCACMYAASPP